MASTFARLALRGSVPRCRPTPRLPRTHTSSKLRSLSTSAQLALAEPQYTPTTITEHDPATGGWGDVAKNAEYLSGKVASSHPTQKKFRHYTVNFVR